MKVTFQAPSPSRPFEELTAGDLFRFVSDIGTNNSDAIYVYLGTGTNDLPVVRRVGISAVVYQNVEPGEFVIRLVPVAITVEER